MTPHTTSTDICRTRLAITSTKPMEIIDPAKAARIMAAEPIKRPFPRNRIMTRATTSLAPEEIPRTKGPAIGFAKKVWSKNPDTERAPPSSAAAKRRFSNVGLGIVHSMAHSLGAVYDTPHGVANAILLPTIMEYNAPCTGDKYKYIAKAMGVEGVENMSQEEYRKAAVDAVKKLSADVGIPADLKAIVKEEDLDFLSESAYADACRPGNPRDTSVEEIKELYKSLM